MQGADGVRVTSDMTAYGVQLLLTYYSPFACNLGLDRSLMAMSIIPMNAGREPSSEQCLRMMAMHRRWGQEGGKKYATCALYSFYGQDY